VLPATYGVETKAFELIERSPINHKTDNQRDDNHNHHHCDMLKQ